MPEQGDRAIYAPTAEGATQLAASTDRWHLFHDHVHRAPHRRNDPRLRRVDAELMPFVDSLDRGARLVIDMQHDFFSPGGWTDASGLGFRACREAIRGVRRSVEMEEACFRDYNCVLLEDAGATSSPEYCRQSVVFNAKPCWGFCTTAGKFAAASPVRR